MPPARTHPRSPTLVAALLGLASSATLILAFPPVFVPAVALLIPLPALLVTRLGGPVWKTALAFGAGTLPAFAILHLWLLGVTPAGYPALVLVLGLETAIFVPLTRRAAKTLPWWIAAPLAWTAVEFLRGRILFDGYPWYLTAQPLAATPLGAAMGSVGVYGLGFLLAWAWAVALTPQRRGPRATVLIAVIVAVFLARQGPSAQAPAETLRIAVVQTNVPQDNKTGWTLEQRDADFARMTALTRVAAGTTPPPDLIVWPETMFPGTALDADSLGALRGAALAYPDGRPATWFADGLLALERELGVPVLAGSIAYDGFRVEVSEEGVRFDSDAEYNSAILIEDGRPSPERYDKLHLTPFGEVMPYISWSDWLESKLLAIGAPGMAFNLDAGRDATVFTVGPARLATPICFEATMPAVCRRLAYTGGHRRVDALVQLTNDGWFGRWPGGRETHLLLTRCRARELGVPVVRAANTGVSAVVLPYGRVSDSLGAWTEGVLAAEVPLAAGAGTVYGRFVGDAPGWLALGGTFVAVAWSFRKKKSPENAA